MGTIFLTPCEQQERLFINLRILIELLRIPSLMITVLSDAVQAGVMTLACAARYQENYVPRITKPTSIYYCFPIILWPGYVVLLYKI